MRNVKQQGQVIIILLLVIVVSLAIGLALVGRSVTEISTSTKTEDSSRAFSAAEAGLERALRQSLSISDFGVGGTAPVLFPALTNQSEVTSIREDYAVPSSGQALEYPPFGKESFAQFWLANPSDLANYYKQSSFDLYFGQNIDYSNNPEDQPAVEVNVIYYEGDIYKSSRFFYDSYIGDNVNRSPIAPPGNGFWTCERYPVGITTSEGSNRSFYCKATVSISNTYPVVVRVKMLYSNLSHPVAIAPVGTGSLPPQVRIFTSTGAAGSVQRTLRVFQQKNVMPFLFDYVLFSAGQVSKQ